MGLSWSDAAADAHDADRAEAALAEALAVAEAVAVSFTEERSANPLRPAVTVDLDLGGDDQPLFVFSMDIELGDDLDASEYPLDEIQELTSALRSRVASSSVDDWAWLVSAGTQAGAAHR